jgi:DNA-binding NtrC family response regulator
MDTLFTWIGEQDLQAFGLRAGNGKIKEGPVLSALRAEKFERVFLISDYSEAPIYKEWLSKSYAGEINLNMVSLGGNPTDLAAIYENTTAMIDRVVDSDLLNETATFHLSPGTWAMAVVWVIISQTRYPGRLIQTSTEAGLQTVDMPFEITAEILTKGANKFDKSLKKANSVRKPLNFGKILFQSDKMQRLAHKAAKASQRDVPVLLEGEVGTEKEEFARAIHTEGLRQKGPFVKIACGSHDQVELSHFLFGKDNVFDQSIGGTLYLEDIGALPASLQSKVYTQINASQDVENLGSSPITKSFRVIASNQNNLIQSVASGSFHEELFFALSVLVLKIPALRERRSDISSLVGQILENINSESTDEPAYQVKSLTPGARHVLIQRDWLANTRELENSLRRAAVWSAGSTITEADIWDSVFETPPTAGALHDILDVDIERGLDLKSKLEDVADHLIDQALVHEKGNKSNAAKLLGFPSYQSFAYWIKRREKKKDGK